MARERRVRTGTGKLVGRASRIPPIGTVVLRSRHAKVFLTSVISTRRAFAELERRLAAKQKQ